MSTTLTERRDRRARRRRPDSMRALRARDAVSSKLTGDLVRKVVDSLCGATFAHDPEGGRSPGAQAFRRAVAAPDTSLLVLLCIEGSRSQAVAAGPWTKDLQRRLRWLGPRARVIVTSRFTPFDELGIRYRVD